jgi:NodT family efflux transporter outer membrane factor (OMF) lipoprotein
MAQRFRAIAGVAFAACLAACATAPAYRPPVLAAPAAYKEVAGWSAARPADQALRGDWWTLFGDPALEVLEGRVDVSNQSLQAAAARLAQARAVVREAGAAGALQVGAGAGADRSRVSATVVGRSLAGKETNDFTLPVAVSWEPDLWGRIASTTAAARANAQASAADLETLRLALHADLAADYFQLRSLDAEARLLRATVAADDKALAMVAERQRVGIASSVDTAQAHAEIEGVRAQLVEVGVARAAAEHALAVIVGEPASTFALPAADDGATGLPPPPAVPLALPSELLQRRPDVAAAERRAAAASAQVGVQRATLFPSLVLGAQGGLESAAMAKLLTLPSRFWSIGPELVGTLMDGGARKSRIQQAQAGYDAAVDDYRQGALVAFQEVEDALATLRILQEEGAVRARATQASTAALALLQDRYRVGVVAYTDVVVAQTTALGNQRQQVDIARRRLLATVRLVKALGGGWQGDPASSHTAGAG